MRPPLNVERTARPKLKPPARVPKESIRAGQKGPDAAKYLAGPPLIIRGESPMDHRCLAECIDRAPMGIREDERPFGGSAFVFGGDFCQIPPIVRRGSRAHDVASARIGRQFGERCAIAY